jgi:hypothetical protein
MVGRDGDILGPGTGILGAAGGAGADAVADVCRGYVPAIKERQGFLSARCVYSSETVGFKNGFSRSNKSVFQTVCLMFCLVPCSFCTPDW